MTIFKNGKSTLLSIYYFGGSEICRLPNFSLSKIISLPNKQNSVNGRSSSKIPVVYAVLCFYYFVSRLSPLPDADSSQADEQEKVLELFTLQWRKKLLQTVYRLTFSYSKRGLATFASDKRDKGLKSIQKIIRLKIYSIG